MLLSCGCGTHFDTEIPSVHIVSQEKVSSFGWIPPDFEEFHQIKVLSMDITTDSDRRVHLQQIGLTFKYLCPHLYDP